MSTEEIEYYRITKDWQLIEGDHPDTVKSDATLYWVHLIDTDDRFSIEFFDCDLNKKDCWKNAFQLSNVNRDGSNYDFWKITLKDRSGAIRYETIHCEKKLNPVIARLIELDELGSWKAFDLQQENQSLKEDLEYEEKRVKERDEKIVELEKEVISLTAEIKQLKNKQ